MPQPIRRECVVQLSGLGPLDEHATWLGKIVAVSGNLEALLGHLLAYLTGSSSTVTISMFLAVTSTDAQRAMLAAAAEEALQGAELEEFRDLMQEFRTRYGERSRLVHNCWGSSPDHPDKAIWCAAKDSTRLSSAFASVKDAAQRDLLMHDTSFALWRKCSTYTVGDMEAAHSRLSGFTERVRLFVMKLLNNHPVWGTNPGPSPSDSPTIEPPPE